MAHDSTTKTLLSFIITYHNEPVEMLHECIRSIRRLNLGDEEYEIVVVDDGSERSPINDLDDQNAHFLYIYQPHQGVSAARNKGMTVASGRYIQFVDADDCLITQGYNHCIKLLKEHPQTDILMFCLSKSGKPDGSPNGTYRATTGTEHMSHNNLRGSVCAYIFRKAAAGELRFSEGTDYAEDEEFTARLMLQAEHVAPTNAKAYHYRQHSQSATHDKERAEKRLADTHTVILRLRNGLDHLPKASQVAMQRRIAQLTMDYLYNTFLLTRSKKRLAETTATLRQEGLFPLPKKHYTMKYSLFRLLSMLLYHSNNRNQ